MKANIPSQQRSLRRLGLWGVLVTTLVCSEVQAQKLPPLFSNGMVLQRDKPIPVWGTADPGAEIRVKFRAQSVSARADADGKWKVDLKPEPAGGPEEMTIEGPVGAIKINDVRVGEVWLASGQSNMVFNLKGMGPELTPDPLPEDPGLRFFNVPQKVEDTPAESVNGRWAGATPHTQAVPYFFGRKLREALEVPVGVIVSAVGATGIATWVSEKGADDVPEAKAKVLADRAEVVAAYPGLLKAHEEALAAWEKAKAEAEAKGEPFKQWKPVRPIPPDTPRHRPFGLYNGMIHPVAPYGLRGFLWYQGESDADPKRSGDYEAMLRALIKDWRARWADPNLSFLIVQLPIFNNEGFVPVRAAQDTVSRDPGNAMAVTLDVGDKGDIHPRNKQPVGERLAALALADVYEKNVPAHSPRATSAEARDGAVHVTFACDDGATLVLKDDTDGSGFEVAGTDGKFVPAHARVDDKVVIVTSSEVAQPKFVRYAWRGVSAVTLFDSHGLPAAPFSLEVH